MRQEHLPEAAVAPGGSRGLGWLALLTCFFLSGVAGLVYQVAWTRQLTLVFGSSELAVAAVLAAFLGGLGVGAAAAVRLAPRVSRPVLVYALLELAVALSALAVPWGIRLAERLYVGVFGLQETLPEAGGSAATLFNLAAAFAILIVPTACMGATLPVLARFAVRRESEIGPATGLLYAINTAGAVVGAPLAGFLLLPGVGLRRTVLVAAGLNLLAFAVALAINRALLAEPLPAPAGSAEAEDGPDAAGPARRQWLLLLLVFGSGVVSLIYEVFWTRLLSHLLGGSLYAFSTMLASFLAGIALGSALASRFASSRSRSVFGFAVAQLGIAVCTLASYALVVRNPVAVSYVWGPEWRLAASALLAAAALLPAALCIGATFPFAVRVLARRASDASPASARVYAWSTLGSIAGSIAAGLYLLPALGFAGTLTAAVAGNLALALAAALALGRRQPQLAFVAAAALAVLALVRPPVPWSVLRSGPLYREPVADRVIHHAVGRNATVLLSEVEEGWRLSTNGLPEGTIQPPGAPIGGYQVGRWLGSIAAFARPEARSMMVIGLGAGGLLEAVPPTIESIDVVELESEVVRANRLVADKRRHDPLSDPRVRLVINDARAALLLSAKPYDAIVSQPSHPWTSGSAHLYTRELFELARSRLGSDGVFVQWIGLAFVDEALLRSLLATLTDVFSHVITIRPPTGAALLFVASQSPLDLASAAPRTISAAAGLPELGLARVEDLMAALVLDAEGSRTASEGAPLVTDDRNLLEAHSHRVLGQGLGRDLAESVVGPYDPLVGDSTSTDDRVALDRVAVVRRLFAVSHSVRALRLAETTTDPAARQVALALVATARGDAELAGRLVDDALSRDPRSVEARALYLRLRGPRIARGATPDPRLLPLTYTEEAVMSAWGHSQRGEWSGVAALDEALATAVAGGPLYREATRLRASWRLAAGGRDHARDALELIDAMLARGRTADDILLRARAAAAAGDARSALASLSDLAQIVARSPRRGTWARPALAVLDALPDDAATAQRRSSVRSMLVSGRPF